MKLESKPPQIGEIRRVTRFAWFPVQTDDGYKVWLETYRVVQVFKMARSGHGWCHLETLALFPA